MANMVMIEGTPEIMARITQLQGVMRKRGLTVLPRKKLPKRLSVKQTRAGSAVTITDTTDGTQLRVPNFALREVVRALKTFCKD